MLRDLLQAVKTVQRMCGLLSVYCVAPIFGVDFEQESAPPPLEELTVDVRVGAPLRPGKMCHLPTYAPVSSLAFLVLTNLLPTRARMQQHHEQHCRVG